MAAAAPLDLSSIYQAAGQEWNVDPNLLQAVSSVESGGTANPDAAVSTAGAQGRMQLMPSTAQGLGVTDPTDPVQSIYGGAKYLSQMLDRYQGQRNPVELALSAYNAGPQRVDDYLNGQGSLPAETVAYVPKVAQQFQALTPPPAANSNAGPSRLDQVINNLRSAPPALQAAPPAQSPAATSQVGPSDPFSLAWLASQSAGKPPGGAGGAPAVAAGPVALPGASPAPSQGQPGQPASDPFSQAWQTAQAVSAPASAPQSGLQAGTGLAGGIENFAEGAGNAALNASHALYGVLNKAETLAPGLNWLDRSVGINPPAALANLNTEAAQYNASGVGNTTAGIAGNLLGGTVVTAPVMGPAGRVVAAGGEAASAALPEISNALTGYANTNALTRGLTYVAKSGLTGAAYGGAQAAATGGDPVQGVEIGGALGGVAVPLVKGVVLGGKLVGSAAGSVVNKLTGSTAALDRDIDAKVAAARAAASADTPAAAPAPAPVSPAVPQASSPTTATQATPSVVTDSTAAAIGASPSAVPMPSSGQPIAASLPQSAGAAATPESILTATTMTPAQAAASRATGFADRLSQRATPGFDNIQYIPGSVPTLAEQLADPELAAQQRVIAPGNSQFATLDYNNNQARVDYYDRLAGSPTTLETLEAARTAQANSDLAAAFANKQPVDAQPVMDQIQSALAGAPGKLDPVRDALQNVAGKLQNAAGTGLETDPEMLYGVRKQVSYLLSKTGQRANPSYAEPTVVRQLQGVKDALDSVIEPGAPGYQQYLQNYAAASRPIDVQELLQGARGNLLNQDGVMQLNRVHSLLKSIGGQLSLPGPNAAKSLSDSDIDSLFNLRQDLLRQNNRYLQRAAGSDTQANQTGAGEMGMNALAVGAHVLGAHVPGGNLLVGPAMSSAIRSSNAKIKNALTNRLLSPEPMQALDTNPNAPQVQPPNALAGAYYPASP